VVERSEIFVELRRHAVASAPTSALAGMFLGGSFALVLSSVVPLSPAAPVRLFEVGAAVCAALSCTIFFLGKRWGRVLLPPGILAAIALLGTIVASARTDAGTAVAVFAFQWLAVYLAYFLPWRAAACYMTTAMVTLNVALLENGIGWERHARFAITATFVAIFALLARLVHRLRVQATTDELTGLLNRSGFMEAVRAEVPNALRRGVPVTLCAIDLDDFKAVNDEVGHSGGDKLLVELARHWKDVLDKQSILSRYGGDEFVIICFGSALEDFPAVLDRMRQSSPLGWSAGFAPLLDVETIEEAIDQADMMLYGVKVTRRVPDSSESRQS
jgi:diguanylate cyclase (GGDEF)-like protein